MGRNYKERDIRLLFGNSGMYCAFPECTVRLAVQATATDKTAVLAQIAHIIGSSNDGPRGDSTYAGDRDGYDNLILLCGNHHALVDKQPATYSVEDLRAWKRSTEAWVTEKLSEGMQNVQFAELAIVCDALVANTEMPSTALSAVPPSKKMAENGLSHVSNLKMQIGLMQSAQVADYLERMATQVDASFPSRLRSGFIVTYDELYSAGIRGDDLFLQMYEFARDSTIRPKSDADHTLEISAAALAVLCHLFQICDVFEAPNDPA